jgi:glycosyltransferase involved in cell wall biosynthesis
MSLVQSDPGTFNSRGAQAAPPISVVVLTFNEEVNIRQALDSVMWCDNVIVVDSYSTDRTEAICRSYANVAWVQHRFCDLATQRQFALDSGLVRHPWVLALDADEYVPSELREELISLASRRRDGDPVAYDTAMRIIMWGRWLRHSSEYPVYWRRFFLRHHVKYVQRGHADTLDVDGPVGRTRHDLMHHDRKGLSDWLAKHNKYTTQEALYALDELAKVPFSNIFSSDRLLRRRALKRVFRGMPCSSLARFLYLYIARGGFLDGRLGYRLCRLRAQQAYIVQLKMDEMRRERARQISAEKSATPAGHERDKNG